MAKKSKKSKKRPRNAPGAVASRSAKTALEVLGEIAPAEAWNLDPLSLYAQVGDEALLGDVHPGTGAGGGGFDLSGLDFSTLRAMARIDVIAAIVGTRVNQVAAFCEPQEEEGQLGYKIRLRDGTAKATKADLERAAWISKFIYNCGVDRAVGRELDFESFTRAVIRDSLEIEQAAFEIVRTRRGEVAGFVPVDGATVRRVRPTGEEKKAGRYSVDEDPAFMQVINERVVASWSSRDFVMGIRRPRTNIHSNRYGFPELEELVKALTSLLHAEGFNAQNFTHGFHAAGVLAVKSKMNQGAWRAFTRNFYAMMSGAANAKRTPVIQLDPENKEELQSINLSSTNREMEFKEWMAFLQKITCAIYQIDPAELGFVYGAEGQSGALTQQGPEARIQFSKEKGLRPLLRVYQKWINRGVVHQIDERFELVFVGLEEQLKNSRLDQRIKKGAAYMTINEIRELDGLPPLKSPAADMIQNATYMNTAMSLDAQAQEQAQGGGEDQGEEDGEDQGDGEDGQGGDQGEDRQGGQAKAKPKDEDKPKAKDDEDEPKDKKQGKSGSPFAAFFKSANGAARRFVVEV